MKGKYFLLFKCVRVLHLRTFYLCFYRIPVSYCPHCDSMCLKIGKTFLWFHISYRCSWGSPADSWGFRAAQIRKNHRTPKNIINSRCFQEKWYCIFPFPLICTISTLFPFSKTERHISVFQKWMFWPLFNAVLWIQNDLFRIRIQLRIFRVPDPGSVRSMRIRIHPILFKYIWKF